MISLRRKSFLQGVFLLAMYSLTFLINTESVTLILMRISLYYLSVFAVGISIAVRQNDKDINTGKRDLIYLSGVLALIFGLLMPYVLRWICRTFFFHDLYLTIGVQMLSVLVIFFVNQLGCLVGSYLAKRRTSS